MEEETDTQQGRFSTLIMFNDVPEEYADDPNYTATQLVMDPRRLGEHNSGLSDQDLADIYCILHPASFPAYKETALMAERTPEHTISSSGMPTRTHKFIGGDRALSPEYDLASQGIVASDIALRLSAKLKNPLHGFIFGRDKRRCDLVIGETEIVRRISNVHFRIYFDENGTLMLLDQSTNGTLIEGRLLCGNAKSPLKAKGYPDKHTLENGSVISFPSYSSDEELKFIVRIPQRDEKYEDLYRQNLADYLDQRYALRQQEVEAKAAALAAGKTTRAGEAPDIFANRNAVAQGFNPYNRSRVGREWRGGSKYNKVRIIGKGAFASVYMITAKFDGTPFAAKELEKRRFIKNGVLDQKVENEIKIMSLIQHPNVVKYVEYIDWDEYLYLILEYVPNGDLGTLIPRHGVLSEAPAKFMAIQLLSALKYLHSLGITHRDVKPDNILVHSYDPLHVKLTDFGLSKMIENDDTNLRTFCGTLLYCAPEVYSEYREYDNAGQRTNRGKHALPPQKYDKAVDLWSLAGVLFFAMSGRPPYPAANGTGYQELLHKIMSQPLDVQPLRSANISDEGIMFVHSMLNINPEARPSIEELEDSAWLKPEGTERSFDSYDEVDLVGQGNQKELEKSASQLSIHDETREELLESLDNSQGDVVELLAQKREPDPEPDRLSSLASSDSLSNEDYTFLRNAPNQSRLFGEVAVNASVIGSSGVFPNNLLNLPVPISTACDQQAFVDNTTMSQQERPIALPKTEEMSENVTALSAPPMVAGTEKAIESYNPGTAPSLLGAESLVGQMQMNSPSPAHSPNLSMDSRQGHDRAATERRHDDKGRELKQRNCLPNLEIYPSQPRRRSRGETEGPAAADNEQSTFKRFRGQVADDVSTSPGANTENPVGKSMSSSRDMLSDLVTPRVFWNPRDKSSHHYNYPQITIEEYNALLTEALSRGENLYPGEKSFEEMIAPYRMSRSPSVEPESWFVHYPQDPPHPGMLRDERRLGEVFGEGDTRNELIPRTPGLNTVEARVGIPLNPSYGNPSFRPPLQILAKLKTTPNSTVQVPTLNITKAVTSWGRGSYNTHVHAEKNDDRIPKYAFKLVLWNPHMDTSKSFKEQLDLNFWISTKATSGIWINDIPLPSYKPTDYDQKSVNWAQLRQGDIITVWKNDNEPKRLTQFRFECNYSSSQHIRAYGSKVFKVLPPGHDQQNLDDFCLGEENKLWAAKRAQRDTASKPTTSTKEESHRKDTEDEKNREPNTVGDVSRKSFAPTAPALHH